MFKWLTATAVVTAGLSLVLVLPVTTTSTASQASAAPSGGPSVQALNAIPATYLALYLAAAQTCPGLPWAFLAAYCRGRKRPRPVDVPGVALGRELRWRRGPDAVRARHFRPVRGSC